MEPPPVFGISEIVIMDYGDSGGRDKLFHTLRIVVMY